ncbi:MAG TPA: DUF1549 domain-containing protein, partial [Pirellulaceae bacterium]|nr:DUF1549 domain-containing protein [Pirellulaceae bacterium]
MAVLRPFLVLSVLSLAASAPADDAALTPAQEKFFEEKVRPVLATNCQECHGAKKQESGLRLDSRAAVIEGGDSGERAAVPGEPERSLLVKAINHVGEYHMPPNRKLTGEQIAALTEWVKDGLPWPAAVTPAAEHKLSAAELVPLHRQSHWAYQPVNRQPLPSVGEAAWLRMRTDAFILAKLDSAQLTPSPEADRRTLIRRLSFDLIGLPPMPEEVETFAADESPDAYERLTDRLLASPRYGERWGRHWLDVVRYADTKGYAFAQERRFPYAYTYRDYVIRALNRDLPYDQFLIEQLAADRLPSDDMTTLAALGFLTTGRKFNNRNDDIDDQIDAVARGMLGITVACARCHDHKYDAIPTEDYYSLYGVFASCSEPGELPLIAPPEQSAEYQKFEEELGKIRGEFDKFVTEAHVAFLDQARHQAADYLARVAAGESQSLLAKLPFLSLDPKDLRPRMIDRWRRYLEEHAKPDHTALGLWHDLLKVSTENFAASSKPVLARWQSLAAGTAAGQCNPVIQQAFAADVPATKVDVARVYGRLLTDAYAQWQAAGGNAEALGKLQAEQRQLAEILLGKGAPTDIERGEVRQYLNRADRNKYQELQKKVESFQATSPLAPPRAMVVADKPQPEEPRVLIRGQPARPGNLVPRQFLLVLS